MKKLILLIMILGTGSFLHAQKLGTLDSSFAGNGILNIDLSKSGKDELVTNSTKGNQGDVFTCGYIGGGTYDLMVSHVLSNGTLDPNFANNGVLVSDFTLGGNEVATSIFRNSDGNLYVTGYFAGQINTDVYVMKITSSGALDNSFGSDGVAKFNLGYDAFASKVAVRPDGKIAVAGSMNAGNGSDFFLLVLNADGSKQMSFGTDGLLMVGFATNSENLTSLLVDANNNMYLGGLTIAAPTTSVAIAKVNSSGNLDNVFGMSGRFTYKEGSNSTYLNDMKFDAQGNIVGVGYVKGGINDDVLVFRITKDGDFDPTFDTDGKRVYGLKIGNPGAERLYGVDIQNDGKIVACGTYIENGTKSCLYLRLQSNGKSDGGFGGTYGYVFISDNDLPVGTLLDVNIVSNERAILVGRTKGASNDAAIVAVHLTEPFPEGLRGMQMNDVQVYPNPTSGIFQIDAVNENVQYSLISLSGQTLHVWEPGTQYFTLPSNVNPGLYLINGTDGVENYRTKIVIK